MTTELDTSIPPVVVPIVRVSVSPVNVHVAIVPVNHANKFENFDGSNFKRWRQKMSFYLITLNLTNFLTEDAPKPVEGQVDESVNKVQSSVPRTLKQVPTQAMDTARKAPQAARSVLADVKNTVMVETASGLAKTVYTKCKPTAKYMYTKYEPVAEQCAVSAWQSLNKLPLFPRVAQAVAPTSSYCSEKYNQGVQVSAEKGFKVASYLPLVPTEKIAKMLNSGNMAEPLVSGVPLMMLFYYDQ